MEYLSTTSLANELDIPVSELFTIFTNKGWIERKNNKWVLTRRGEQSGEAFIRNFYKLEQQKYTTVRTETIYWQFSSVEPKSKQFIPEMHTDITLENDTHKIIMNAKYYRQTMLLNYEKERIHSGNLYQLFSYLINQEDGSARSAQATGILLYPSVQGDYDLEYQYKQHPIKIKTIDLNTDWYCISARLLSLIEN